MKCVNPYTSSVGLFGCGQCIACRINRRRLWTARILLESLGYEDNAFATLTYNEDELPMVDRPGSNRSTLVIKDYQDWLKRLRKRLDPIKVRYFLVGEYGNKTERPHFHAILFGFPTCRHGRSQFNRDGHCCSSCEIIRDTWKHGHIVLGDVNVKSVAYCASYTVKKMTVKDDFRLDGRYPEFARMSLRPGIGTALLDHVASTLMTVGIRDDEDVPATLRIGGKVWPLGRYLRGQLRTLIGREDCAHPSTVKSMVDELRELRSEAEEAEENFTPWLRKKNASREKVYHARERALKKEGSI